MKDNCGSFDKKVPGIEVTGGSNLSAGAKDMLAKAHPDIQKALVDLRKHETKVLAALKARPELAAKFVTDPASVLAALEIPIDSQLRARLKSAPLQPDFLKPRTFCLPTGKMLNAKVRLSIVSGATGTDLNSHQRDDVDDYDDDDNDNNNNSNHLHQHSHYHHHHHQHQHQQPQKNKDDEREKNVEAARRK